MISAPIADLKAQQSTARLSAGPMLPATIQFIIAMVAHAIHERMARRVDYLQTEAPVLEYWNNYAKPRSRAR